MSVPALMIPALAVAAATLIVLVAVLATRPKQKKSTIRLSAEQRAAIQDHFTSGPTLAGSYGWSRRQYAPMHIHSKAFSSLRDQIAAQLPDHAIAFDVVFESQGKRVDWHGDYESLGPFAFDGVSSIQNHDFVSVHFNITADGGSLATLDWPLVSTIHHFVIVKWGIYSRPHKLLNFLSRPLFWLFATTRPNTVGVGNSFDNMRLHSVGAGAARLSYVVRLVRRNGGVTMSPATVATCASRSTACERLTKVLAPAVTSPTAAGTFAWAGLAADL